MPHVNILGHGVAKFPDGMPPEDIRTALRNKFSQDVINNKPFELPINIDTAAPVDTSLSDNIKQVVSNFLVDNNLISNRHAAQDIGKTIGSVGDFIPGIGDATAGDEFGRAVAQGDKFGMAMASLSAIPIIGKELKKGTKAASKLGFDTSKTWYHGTRADIREFKDDFLGSTTGAASSKKGTFFTSSPLVASGYSGIGDTRKIRDLKSKFFEIIGGKKKKNETLDVLSSNSEAKEIYDKLADLVPSQFKEDPEIYKLGKDAEVKLDDMYSKSKYSTFNEFITKNKNNDKVKRLQSIMEAGELSYFEHGSNVMPVHLKMDNPLVKDYKGSRYRDESYSSLLDEAIKNGNDSVLIKNTFDPGGKGYNEITNIAVILDKNNIKSKFAKYKEMNGLLGGTGAFYLMGGSDKNTNELQY